MAETVKILSPEKDIILVNPNAVCPMAEQIDTETLAYIKENNKSTLVSPPVQP